MSQQIVQMTQEQLQQLIDSVRNVATAGAASATADLLAVKSKGSFSNCSACYNGERNHNIVEEFLTAIATYKDVESINDEDALRGISLLFRGIASTWWQGVRKEAKTWSEAVALIRDHFSPTKPNYQVYMEIFENRQEEQTAIDTFVCEKRALLAQLPEERHDEESELDLTYGLLNIKYRQHIPRYEVKTFRDLLEKGRVIEHNSAEARQRYAGVMPAASSARYSVKRCTHCNCRGHTREECRKLKRVGGGAAPQ